MMYVENLCTKKHNLPYEYILFDEAQIQMADAIILKCSNTSHVGDHVSTDI